MNTMLNEKAEWKQQAMSVAGSGHIARNMPCQDNVFCCSRGNVYAAALSDGAGSYAHSEEGSAVASETAAKLFAENFDAYYNAASPDLVKRSVLTAVRSAISKRAQTLGVNPRELACTLLVCAVQGDRFLMMHVGDGVVVCQKDGKLKLVSAPDNGEFANTTVFVTSDAVMAHTRIRRGVEPLLEGFCLMSDGCENALYSKRKKKPARLISRMLLQCGLFGRDAADARLFFQLGDLIAARTSDDCSLALLSRCGGSFGDWNRMQPREKADLLGISSQNSAKCRRSIRREAAKCGIEG